MKLKFPGLPKDEYSWRSIQVEPIPSSGERITLGTVVKGADKSLIAAKLVNYSKLKSIYGKEFSKRIFDALSLCINSAEEYYKNNSLNVDWTPPLEGFYISTLNSSVANDIEEGLLRAAMFCSSFSASYEFEKDNEKGGRAISFPELWRKNIFEAVRIKREDFINYFEQSISLRGKGVPFTFDFLSNSYAAQFDAISEVKSVQSVLLRAQSKLWQLDCLRDAQINSLFKPSKYELLIKIPSISSNENESSILKEFLEEVQYEASRKELGVFSTASPNDAAVHLIDKVNEAA